MSKLELTPEQEKEGYRIEDGYLYDKDNNLWDLQDITLEEAIEYSKTLQNCTDCERCEDCKDCIGCTGLNHARYMIYNKKCTKEEYV